MLVSCILCRGTGRPQLESGRCLRHVVSLFWLGGILGISRGRLSGKSVDRSAAAVEGGTILFSVR